jgi:hypothetical protein
MKAEILFVSLRSRVFALKCSPFHSALCQGLQLFE